MLISTRVIVFWCCCSGLLIPRQMLHHQGLLKCRCRMLFNDLKVFLLRRPPAPPPPSPLPLPPMSRTDQALSLQASNNNTLNTLYGGRWAPRRAPTDGGDGGGGGGGGGITSPPEEEWESPGGEGELPTTVMSSASSDDFCKGKAEDGYSLGSSLDSGMRTPLCRICFQGPEQGELLSPCRCDGSVKCTHQPCLIKWISERGCWSCELCYYKYHVIAISTKNPLQWQTISLTVIEKVQIAAAILGSLFLIASISWLIWSTFSPSAKWQRQDLLFQICYGMYGFMDIVCIGLIIHEGPSVYRIFKRWQAVNQQWKVLNYDKTKDLEDQKSGSRSNQRNSSQINHSSSTNGTASNSAAEDSVARGAGHATGTLSDHHCAYTILHILSHLRPNEQRSHSSTNRELVMRVTTV
ncbi:E3 ubiquitin-protein ligase MARCH4 [Pseudonaja textilis]|uniref:RING-type E3 ubiquitin transferase n=1 Tax=Pseudonaja textilis TaxID=8673 RepID=A0A670YFC9_PSETE|nr:E3 ubiquitin-protein ligase MARCH4 [Pseudonaja textilis]